MDARDVGPVGKVQPVGRVSLVQLAHGLIVGDLEDRPAIDETGEFLISRIRQDRAERRGKAGTQEFGAGRDLLQDRGLIEVAVLLVEPGERSEEQTSVLQSLMSIS